MTTTETPSAEDFTIVSFPRRLVELADTQPNAIAVTCDGEQITYEELVSRSRRMARVLFDNGVGWSDFVTIAEPNSPQFIIATIASWFIGAIPQPVSSRLPRLELEAIVELADSAAVLGADVEGRTCFPIGFEPDASVDSGPLPNAISPAWKAPTSGGSTGRPKLIIAGDPALWIQPMQNLATIIGAAPRETMVMPGPLYHNGPFIWTFYTLLVGGNVALLRRFDAEATLAAIADNKARAIYMVPTMMQRMAKLPEETKRSYDVSSLKVAFHLAEPCPQWLKDEWIEWIGPEALYELYGGTEGQMFTVIRGDEWLEHRGSVGRPVVGEVAIFSAEGDPVPPGTEGEVWMRWTNRDRPTYTYVGDEAERREDGWECLGDMGWIDEEGYLYLGDRRKDMILVGGANVYPAEIEAAIGSHPDVLSSAVIGLPDEDKGSIIHAIVQRRPDAELSQDELLAFLADRLVVYKLPRSVEWVTESLRDDAGKVRRSALAAARTGDQ